MSDSRKETDAKLQGERDRTNDEILDRVTALGETADDLTRRARERAGSVLALARGREDDAMNHSHVDAKEITSVASARVLADRVTKAEQLEADAAITSERARQRRAVIQLLALERDETDRMLTAERLDADRKLVARDDTLGLVSHDLRGHLNVLLVGAAVVATRSNDPQLVANAGAMQRAAAQMDSLVRDLLDVVAIESGRMRVERRTTDLTSIVHDEVEVHRAAAEARQLHLTLDVAAPSVTADVDPDRFSRALMNVLTNAIKFTPSGGRIDVTVDRRGDQAHIAVTDSGRGIAADSLEGIFDRFARVGSRKPGYGLGLFIARTIVDAHDGRIWAESVLGQGSTFHIELPVTAPAR